MSSYLHRIAPYNFDDRYKPGVSVSLLGDPNNFDVDLLLVKFDGDGITITQNELNKSKEGDGLFTFFSTEKTAFGLHTVIVQKHANATRGLWNLVEILYVIFGKDSILLNTV